MCLEFLKTRSFVLLYFRILSNHEQIGKFQNMTVSEIKKPGVKSYTASWGLVLVCVWDS